MNTRRLTPSAALEIIRQTYGRGSQEHTRACHRLSRGQQDRVLNEARAIMASLGAFEVSA